MALILVAVLVTFSAQQVLTPILAPLSRELTLTETELGLVITVASAMLTIMSPVWGRAVDRIGARATLLLGLGAATAGLAGFAVFARLGLDGHTTPGWTVAFFLVTRSVLFGGGLAAIPVVALALAATTTDGDHARTKAIGLVGAAQGVSLVLGPAAGGALAAFSLLLPVYVAPVLLLALLVVLAFTLRPAAAESTGPRARLSPFDGRLFPVLVVGFVLYLSLAQVQVVLGFLVADRLGLDSEATAGAVGLTLFVAGVVLVGMQAVVVPKLRWSPLRLMRAGIPLAVVAFGVLAMAGHLWSITVGTALLAGRSGLGHPGLHDGADVARGATRAGCRFGARERQHWVDVCRWPAFWHRAVRVDSSRATRTSARTVRGGDAVRVLGAGGPAHWGELRHRWSWHWRRPANQAHQIDQDVENLFQELGEYLGQWRNVRPGQLVASCLDSRAGFFNERTAF